MEKLRRAFILAIALAIAIGSDGAVEPPLSAQEPDSLRPYRRMADGKEWTTQNLNLTTEGSFCYADAEVSCRRYGRLYTWESARKACQLLGDHWRLPTDKEWRQLANHFGGISTDSKDGGKSAYRALSAGGNSGFEALLGGGRASDGQYGRLEAHGFYWTASESDPTGVCFYNFASGGQALHRQDGGEKERAFSVRCVGTKTESEFVFRGRGGTRLFPLDQRSGKHAAYSAAETSRISPGRCV